MPNYKTHLIAGAVSFYLVMRTTATYIPTLSMPLEYLSLGLALSLIGSIFPDIDVPSKMQKWFFVASIILILISLLHQNHTLFAGLGISVVFVAFLTHRTITHKPAFLLLIALVPVMGVIYALPAHSTIALAGYLYFTVGCLSHVLLDRLLTFFNRLIGKARRF